jgi:uncharacterized protein YchJ
MVGLKTCAAALLLALSFGSAASAGIYTDDLSRCLVKSATAEDQAQLVRWEFAEFALNPALSTVSSVTSDQRKALERQSAALFERLVLTDCRKETEAALKYEGNVAFQASFAVLGQVAARGLMSDPKVNEGMAGMVAFLDSPKWDAMAKEAGIPSLGLGTKK